MDWFTNFQQHIKIFLQLSVLKGHNQIRQFPRSRVKFDLFWCNHLCSEDMFKCNDLFRGQLPVTKEQLEPVLFDAATSIQRTTWSWEEVGGTICSWTLDKLKHRKLSLVCLGFTSINVPPMLKCPGSSAFRHTKCQESHLAAMSLRYYALCTLTRGQWGGTDVWCYIWVLFWGCRDLLSWTTKQDSTWGIRPKMSGATFGSPGGGAGWWRCRRLKRISWWREW